MRDGVGAEDLFGVLSGGAADSRRRVIFSVWAPFAKSVDLVTQERRVAMQSDARRLLACRSRRLERAGGYKYALDGGTPLPDPRSRWQPDGVHGASHLIDADVSASVSPAGLSRGSR